MLGTLVHGFYIYICINTLILDFDTHGTCGWLYELVFDHHTLILGPFVGVIVEPYVFSLRSLIWWLASWNPNHGHLEFVDHVGLTIGLMIEWNPNSLEAGSLSPCHASSIIMFSFFLGIIHQLILVHPRLLIHVS